MWQLLVKRVLPAINLTLRVHAPSKSFKHFKGKAWPIVLLLCFCNSSAFAFDSIFFNLEHSAITREAFDQIEARPVGGININFQARAAAQVEAANISVDLLFGFIPNVLALTPLNHFDDEQFAGATQRLRQLAGTTIAAARGGDGSAARKNLGEALHTLQDFYSHSNWVEIGHSSDINPGIDVILPNPLPSPLFQPCPNNPNVLEGAGLRELTSGYFSAPGLIGQITGVCEPIAPGKCYHGQRIACPGITKDSPNHPNHLTARALAVAHTKHTLILFLTSWRPAPIQRRP